MSSSLVKFVNSKAFTYSWIVLSLFMLAVSSTLSFRGITLLFVLTLIEGLLDVYIGHGYSLGISRKLTFINTVANFIGVVTKSMYGLWGGAVTSSIGFMLLVHKFLTWDSDTDSKISHFRKQEMTLARLGVLFGVVALSVIYGFLFRGNQPLWLVGLNVLVFFLGITSRILLLNGKVESQMLYLVLEFVNIGIFVSMLILGLASGSFWIRSATHISNLIILFKSIVNWQHGAEN